MADLMVYFPFTVSLISSHSLSCYVRMKMGCRQIGGVLVFWLQSTGRDFFWQLVTDLGAPEVADTDAATPATENYAS